ncbi:hypothetical protein G6F63_016547 [Rhizopus arrhizus]|nr:hypothetical protein G6F63_016547 [Rhizopus arrhizus]
MDATSAMAWPWCRASQACSRRTPAASCSARSACSSTTWACTGSLPSKLGSSRWRAACGRCCASSAIASTTRRHLPTTGLRCRSSSSPWSRSHSAASACWPWRWAR